MSAQAKRFDLRPIAAIVAAEDGYDFVSSSGRNGLIARAVSEAKQVGRKWSPITGFKPVISYCPNGLMALSDKGIAVFEAIHPNTLPWNLFKAGPAGQQHYAKNIECSREERDALVAAHARFGGWIAKASELPLLAKAIKQAVSPRGTGSRRTYVNLWVLAGKFNSPHALQRRIGAVQDRAIEILRAYDGRGCSLRSTLMALAVNGSIGKAAVIAAYRSLTGEQATSYPAARNALVELKACSVPDSTDGVAILRTAEPTVSEGGVRVYPYAVKNHQKGWPRGFLVLRDDGRSFHYGPNARGDWTGGGVIYSEEPSWRVIGYVEPQSAQAAIGAAKVAWAKQEELEMSQGDFLRLLQPEGFSPLVYFQDSRNAGNCAEGTRAFMDRIGIKAGTEFVSAKRLIPFIEEKRVANTLRLVARKVTTLLAA